jgi:hypothetical protein
MTHKRRHSNTKGTRQIQRGKPEERARQLARELGVPYGKPEADRCTCGRHDCESCAVKCQREGCNRRTDCSHVVCPLRRTLTVGIPDHCGRPRLADEYVPPDER